MAEVAESPPKLFISYRWSSPEHTEWVLGLATTRRSDGIDVKLDRWDLRPGHDALAFMEGMVTDESIQKVLLVCDRAYVERADNRSGGVGVEAQIISPKIYESTSQEKFAAILLELDDDGRPLLPTFLASRIYFDFTTEEAKAKNYEEIVRWVFDKPIDVRPPVGRPPKYLEAEARSPISIPKAISRGGLDRSAASKATALQALDAVASSAGNLVLDLKSEPDQPETVYQALLDTTPLREEVYNAFRVLLRSEDEKVFEAVHTFFEDVSKFSEHRPHSGVFSRLDNDVVKYFVNECFVGFVALSIAEGLYGPLSDFLVEPYYRPDHDGRTGKAVHYTEFRAHLESLEVRNQQKKLNRISLHADVIAETHQHSLVPLDRFSEADFILYVRGLLASNYKWYPVSGIWLSHTYGSLRIFARAQSGKFYNRISPLLFGRSASNLREALAPYVSGEQQVVRFDYETLPIARLMNLENLATTA
jgi:hypothetical protein